MFNIKSYLKISKIKKHWIELYRNNPNISPFVDYYYFQRTIKFFSYYFIVKRCYIRYYCVFDKNTPILIAPILIFINGRKELFGNINGFNYSDFVYKECNRLSDALTYLYNNIGIFDIYKIRVNSYIIDLIKKYYSSNSLNTNVKIVFGHNYNEYYNNLSKSVRQNLRTSYNRLEKFNYKFELKVVYGGELQNTTSFFNDVIDLYCKRHESRYKLKYNIIKRYLLKHYHFATENYKKLPTAITFGLYINNTLAAFMSGLISKRDEFIVPRLSINNDFAFFSPGILLINEVIKYFISSTKIICMDLSQGEENYKYKMGGIKHYTSTLLVK